MSDQICHSYMYFGYILYNIILCPEPTTECPSSKSLSQRIFAWAPSKARVGERGGGRVVRWPVDGRCGLVPFRASNASMPNIVHVSLDLGISFSYLFRREKWMAKAGEMRAGGKTIKPFFRHFDRFPLIMRLVTMAGWMAQWRRGSYHGIIVLVYICVCFFSPLFLFLFVSRDGMNDKVIHVCPGKKGIG